MRFRDTQPVDTTGTDGTPGLHLGKRVQKYNQSMPKTGHSYCVQAAHGGVCLRRFSIIYVIVIQGVLNQRQLDLAKTFHLSFRGWWCLLNTLLSSKM